MKKIKLVSILLAVAITSFVYVSCTKEDAVSEITALDNLSAATQDDAEVNASFDDAFNQADNYGDYTANLKGACPSVTVNPVGTTFPKTITVDFGTACTDNKNVVRKGKIIIVVSGPRTVVNSTRTVTFQNFESNGNKIEGQKVITYQGLVNNKPSVKIVVTNGKVTTLDGRVLTYASDRTRIFTAGSDTPLVLDDNVFSITGTASGVNAKGKAYSATIINPLIVAFGCRYIKGGKIEISSESHKATIDYGDGTTCDEKATISIDGSAANDIILKKS